MRSGIELLFLPRRMGCMPYGLAAKRVGGPDARIPILRIRHAYNHRCAVRQDSVRLALSLRAGAGPALQDTAKEKNTAAARREIPAQDTLRRTRGHVHTAAHACQGLIRRGYAMVLQQDYLVPTQAMLERQAPFTVVFQDGNVVAKSVPIGEEETA